MSQISFGMRLRETLGNGKVFRKDSLKFTISHFGDMEGIFFLISRIRLEFAIRTAANAQSVRLQNPCNLLQETLRFFQMFNCFEANDHIESVVNERKFASVGIRQQSLTFMPIGNNRFDSKIDTDDGCGAGLTKNFRAISSAAGYV